MQVKTVRPIRKLKCINIRLEQIVKLHAAWKAFPPCQLECPVSCGHI